MFCHLTVLRYERGAADLYEQFRAQRIAVGPMDLKIAAIAMSFDAVLVTRNFADFRKIDGLRLEDWSAEPEP